ncbi:MAG: helix-turn-helix domain-containing protein [Azospirillum sp.]|nr:helix-turn-helix domain-containing protein [Azospirillum sp.]
MTAGLGTPYPKIDAVAAGAYPEIAVTWADGTEHRIDLGGFIADHPTLAHCAAPGVWASMRVGEWGWSAGWDDDSEIGADALWALGTAQEAARLRAWRKARGLTQAQAAKALGLGTRTVTLYEAGSQPIPKTVILARVGFDALHPV